MERQPFIKQGRQSSTERWLGCSYNKTRNHTQREHAGCAFKRQGGHSRMTWCGSEPVGEEGRLPSETGLRLERECMATVLTTT